MTHFFYLVAKITIIYETSKYFAQILNLLSQHTVSPKARCSLESAHCQTLATPQLATHPSCK